MSKREKYLIATAAGKGSRMGGNLPKQFLDLAGDPVLIRTLRQFFLAISDLRVLTVLSPEMKEYWRELCYKHNFHKSQKLVDGGLTRFHSIKNALEFVPDDALVAVHDGVRPLLSQQLIQQMFEIAEEKGAVVPCLPSSDTLRCLEADGNLWKSSSSDSLPAREKIFQVQTPQVFEASLLKAAYALPFEPSFTDDASVVEKYLSLHPEENKSVYYALGEKYNIKLTTPEDMTLAKAILSLISE